MAQAGLLRQCPYHDSSGLAHFRALVIARNTAQETLLSRHDENRPSPSHTECDLKTHFSERAIWTLLTKVETSCDRILIAGGANVEAEWEQGPAV